MSNNKDNKDYTKKAFALTLLVIIILIGVAFIPPFKLGAVAFRRANILSDIISFNDIPLSARSGKDLLDTSFMELLKKSDDVQEDDACALPDITGEPGQPAVDGSGKFIKPIVSDTSIVRIEDFSDDERMMSVFYNSLAVESASRTVRIAVLGDSFIESDIITADLRELLQLEYGGSGVGFVPLSTPLSKYRGTIRHDHSGWETYNIIKLKSVPEDYRGCFFISGIVSIPEEGATIDYKGVKFRSRIESTNTAAILFANRNNSKLEVSVNETIRNIYEPETGEGITGIFIKQPDISKLGIKITDADGFIGYGVVLEDSVGVSVHNFSVRSNSGMALLGTNYGVNSQINALMKYDLIILQYGLNAMAPDVLDYKYYGRQLCRIVEYIKKCFPGSAILVMSVGDRSTIKDGTAVTMPAVKAMIEVQREAARNSKVGFWNTFEAMGGDNSMSEFVEKKWASKDYTHIGYQGGRYIAKRLADYLKAAVASIREIREGNVQIAPQEFEEAPGSNDHSPELTTPAGAGSKDVHVDTHKDSLCGVLNDSIAVIGKDVPIQGEEQPIQDIATELRKDTADMDNVEPGLQPDGQ